MATKPTFQNLGVSGDLGFSVRRLSNSQRNVMRVRESGGDTLADIPLYGNVIDRQALMDHCGVNDGFLHTWYNASGSNHATQTTNADQPQIVSSGNVIEVNGMPAVLFSGSQFMETSSGPSLASTAYTIAAVFQFSTVADFSQAIWDAETNKCFFGLSGASDLEIGNTGADIVLEAMDTNQATFVWKNGSYRYNDDASDTSCTTLTHTMDGITIGHLRVSARGSAFEFNGHIQEIVRYNSTSIALADIQADQREFYIDHIIPVTRSVRLVGAGGGLVG